MLSLKPSSQGWAIRMWRLWMIPAVDPEDADVFVGPVTAIASRHPFVSPPTALAYPGEFVDNAEVAEDFTFRRGGHTRRGGYTASWDRWCFTSAI